MKIKALVLALALTSFAFGQKAAISYVYSTSNPYGGAVHLFYPKQPFGLFADYNTREKNNTVFESSYENTKYEAMMPLDSFFKSYSSGRYSTHTFSIGAFYMPTKFIGIQFGLGNEVIQNYFKGEGGVRNYDKNEWRKFAYLTTISNTNFNIGVWGVIKKVIRAGVSYDTAPKTFRVELGYVIK